MKRAITFALMLSALMFGTSAFASVAVESDGTRVGEAKTINFSTGFTASKSGGLITVVAAPSAITSAVFEGVTADAYETTLDVVDPTADNTVTLPDATGYVVLSTLATNSITAANSVWNASNAVVFEGATADAFETSLAAVDPTADQTASLPNFAVNYALLGSTLTTNNVDAANSVWGVSNGLVFEGATADAFETTLTVGDPTADQTITLPATAGAAGTVELKSTTVVITAGATPTLTVPVGVNFIATDTITTDNQDQTITFSAGGAVGQVCTIVFQTDSGGSGDEVITFQTTLTNSAGTLTLANLTAGRYSVTFQSDGTVWNEVSRSAALS